MMNDNNTKCPHYPKLIYDIMSSKGTNRLFNLNDNNFYMNQHYEYDLRILIKSS